MKKIPYPDLNVNLYEEILPNKLKLLVIPFKSKALRVGLYVSKGSYNTAEKIQNTKIFSCMAMLLSMVLKNTPYGNIDDILKSHLASLKTTVKESYTYYEIEGYEPNFDFYVDELLKMTTNFVATEEIVEKTKLNFYKNFDEYYKDPVNSIIDDTRRCLYQKSLIKEGVFGNYEDIKSVHLNTLKKFFNQYYQTSNMTLIVSGNVEPLQVSKYVASLKLLNNFKKETETLFKLDENYGTTNKSSLIKEFDNLKENLVSIGIKFLPRQELFNQFGSDLFSFYELLGEFLFGKNSKFVSEMRDKRIVEDVVRISLVEGSEDAYLVAVFKAFDIASLKKELYDYIFSLEKNVDKKYLDVVLKSYYGKNCQNIGNMDKFLLKTVDVYANHMAYPSLIMAIRKIKKGLFIQFLKNLASFPNSIVTYKKDA